MSGAGDNAEVEHDHRHGAGTAPYSSHNPVPNIARYKERQEERKQQESSPGGADLSPESKLKRFKSIFRSRNSSRSSFGSDSLYDTRNRNSLRHSWAGADFQKAARDQEPLGKDVPQKDTPKQEHKEEAAKEAPAKDADNIPSEVDGIKDSTGAGASKDGGAEQEQDGKPVDTSEVAGDQSDARAKRKAMKDTHTGGERQVTDPVTHLQTIVHDFTQKELEQAPHSLNPKRVGTGLSAGTERDEAEIEAETKDMQEGDIATKYLFPPPSSNALQRDLGSIYNRAVTFGLNILGAILFSALFIGWGLQHWLDLNERTAVYISGGLLMACSLLAGTINWAVGGWLQNRVESAFQDHVWEKSFKQEQKVRSDMPESTMWLNSFLAGVWPLINPDLFTGIADTLEDVMQASLPPKIVRMVAVVDLGQGAIAPRILGARFLPTGAADQNVSIDGQRESKKKEEQSDRKVPEQGQIEQADDSKKAQEEDDDAVKEGLEAESGDFTNMELMFSYRTLPDGESLKDKSKAAHIYLVFYLPGNIPFPVYVSLRGIVGKMRLRMQLSPDPPFVNLCTITFLGQPKVDVSCIPLARKFLNLVDLPVIGSFVQSSIDAALSEYVAPRSLTLDLKQMLQGDDFKKNTDARGIIVVKIKRAYDFKEADSGLGPFKEGSSDSYVSVGWAKFGKPLWSTRVILKSMTPVWQETAYLLVGSEEINAQESLRVQLWDSDRMSADDDLGRIEFPLDEIMKNKKQEFVDRSDGFISMDADEKMPGTLDWAVGYFEKVQITEDQFKAQSIEPDIRSMQQLQDKVTKEAGKKLREADRDVSDETDQQRAQDFEEHADKLISAAPPPQGYPSGIISIQIHNITGLQVAKLKKDRNNSGDDYEESSETAEDDLPSSYATIILNGRPVFRTRTKPKNAKPYFNATTERFIRDWSNTEVIVSVRDARTDENDPLLGFVYLPLDQLIGNRSQINDTYPISGGAGFGRMRVSMMFRSVDMKLPPNLLGWDYGTLEITGPITFTDLPDDIKNLNLKVRTNLGSGKLYISDNEWKAKKDRKVRLAVASRYSTNLVFEFKSNTSFGRDRIAGFAILWLREIPDDDEQHVEIPVWSGESDFERAKTHCMDECGEKVGTIKVPLKLYSGLSEYHKPLAKQRPEVGRVMEVMDAAADQQEMDDEIPDDGDHPDTSSSSSDDDEDGLEKDGSRGPISSMKDYKKHAKVLHRKQRGVMQWKTARQANWLKTKADHGFDKIAHGLFSHHDREPDIETEV